MITSAVNFDCLVNIESILKNKNYFIKESTAFFTLPCFSNNSFAVS
jgi:hypothetical protein